MKNKELNLLIKDIIYDHFPSKNGDIVMDKVRLKCKNSIVNQVKRLLKKQEKLLKLHYDDVFQTVMDSADSKSCIWFDETSEAIMKLQEEK